MTRYFFPAARAVALRGVGNSGLAESADVC